MNHRAGQVGVGFYFYKLNWLRATSMPGTLSEICDQRLLGWTPTSRTLGTNTWRMRQQRPLSYAAVPTCTVHQLTLSQYTRSEEDCIYVCIRMSMYACMLCLLVAYAYLIACQFGRGLYAVSVMTIIASSCFSDLDRSCDNPKHMCVRACLCVRMYICMYHRA